jgi:FAD/FMN-containing dehydrogenase
MQLVGDLVLLEGFSGDHLITGVVFNEQYINRLSRGHGRCLSQGPRARQATLRHTRQRRVEAYARRSRKRWSLGSRS